MITFLSFLRYKPDISLKMRAKPAAIAWCITLLLILEVSNEEEFDRPGLHLGAISMSEDFDEPLPDEFWSGKV
jgi:hypothetical protein